MFKCDCPMILHRVGGYSTQHSWTCPAVLARIAAVVLVLSLAGCSDLEEVRIAAWKERCAAMKGLIAYERDSMTAECFRTPPFMMPKSLWKATYPEVPT